MTALERINRYTDQLVKDYSCQMCGFKSVENAFLLKAFHVMRKMGLEREWLLKRNHPDVTEIQFDLDFEKEMSNVIR